VKVGRHAGAGPGLVPDVTACAGCVPDILRACRPAAHERRTLQGRRPHQRAQLLELPPRAVAGRHAEPYPGLVPDVTDMTFFSNRYNKDTIVHGQAQA